MKGISHSHGYPSGPTNGPPYFAERQMRLTSNDPDRPRSRSIRGEFWELPYGSTPRCYNVGGAKYSGDDGMKCQRCPKQVAYHVTEVLGEGRVEDLHLCDDCAKKYLFQTPVPVASGAAASADANDGAAHGQAQCPECGLKFVEFRNGGRLGCPHDYDAFREDLVPLLESVHGVTRHAGKTPRTRPRAKTSHNELAALRKKLRVAVEGEKYEEAAAIRDKIKTLETA